MPFTTTKPVGQFTDINGKPLDGQVFFGQPNLDPIANPITVYWDAAGTQPVTQPVVTVGGYPMNGSTRSNVFVNADYSILVRNRNGFTVFSAPNLPFEDSSDNQYFLQAGAGAVQRTVQSKLRDVVSVKDFGAVADGLTDDTAAIQAAANAISSGGSLTFANKKTYKITAAIQLNAGVSVLGNGSKLKCYECDGLTYPPLPIGGGGTREINFLHVQIENLQFENLTATLSDYECARDATYSGIRIVDSAGIFIKNCRFYSFHRGIWLTGCQLVSVQSCYFWRCWLGYKTFGDPNGAPHGIGPVTQSDGHAVNRNFFDQCVYPVYITGYGANQGPITVERNYCFAPAAALANDNFYMRVGIILESAKGASVSYNTFDAYTVYNGYKANNANFTFVPNTACILVDYHTADAYLTEANILGTPARNGGADQDITGITIQGNSLRSMGYGVLIKHALGVQITANDFQDLTSKGVRSFDQFNSGLSLNNYWFGWETLSPVVDEYDIGIARIKIAEPYRNLGWRSNLEPTTVTTQRGVASGGTAGDITVTFPVPFTSAPFIQLTATGNPPAGSSVFAFLRSWSSTSMVIGRQVDNGSSINDIILDVMWEATGPTY